MLVIRAKDCRHEVIKFQIPEQEIVKRISSILQFTTYDGFRPAFDILSTFNCDNLTCLIETAEKLFKNDIAMWITARIKLLSKFIDGNNVVIPICLNDDELIKRLVVGILYAIRRFISMPIAVDDMLGFVINESYRESFVAMMRPFIVSINRYLDTRDLLQFNPIIITPGGHGGFYRLARPDRYIVLFDHSRWEVPRREIERLANS
jgi:hypothetical protein